MNLAQYENEPKDRRDKDVSFAVMEWCRKHAFYGDKKQTYKALYNNLHIQPLSSHIYFHGVFSFSMNFYFFSLILRSAIFSLMSFFCNSSARTFP